MSWGLWHMCNLRKQESSRQVIWIFRGGQAFYMVLRCGWLCGGSSVAGRMWNLRWSLNELLEKSRFYHQSPLGWRETEQLTFAYLNQWWDCNYPNDRSIYIFTFVSYKLSLLAFFIYICLFRVNLNMEPIKEHFRHILLYYSLRKKRSSGD